jgi:GT2 family glycosyltransferase
MVQYRHASWLTLEESLTVAKQPPAGLLDLPPVQESAHAPTGLLYALRREVFEAVNGFDERFQGWGLEDPAFAAAVRTLAGPIRRVAYPIYHLYHPKEEEVTDAAVIERNQALYQAYRASEGNPTAMQALVKENRRESV